MRLKEILARTDHSGMSVSPPTLSPLNAKPAKFPACPAEEEDVPALDAVAARDYATLSRPERSATSSTPTVLFLVGLSIYFVSIAAFASFAGVAVGVVVIVLGVIVFTCAGLRGTLSTPRTGHECLPHCCEGVAALPNLTGEFEASPESRVRPNIGIRPKITVENAAVLEEETHAKAAATLV